MTNNKITKMVKASSLSLSILTAGALFSNGANAASIVEYKFNTPGATVTDTESLISLTSSNVSVNGLGQTSRLASLASNSTNAAAGSGGTVTAGAMSGRYVEAATSAGSTVTIAPTSDYASFIITPTSSFSMQSIGFDFSSDGSVGNSVVVKYNALGGDWDTNSVTVGQATTSLQSFEFLNFNFDLASTVATQAVEFRLYGLSDGSAEMGLDNLAVEVAAVPEPSTAVLSILGLTCLIGRRQRK